MTRTTVALVGIAASVWSLATPPVVAQETTSTGDRITFSLPLSEDQGGGEVQGEAEQLDYLDDGGVLLMGDVVVRYQDVTIRASQVDVGLVDRVVKAQGNVVFDQGPSRITGATAQFDLTTKTGTITQASAAIDGGYYFSGEEVSRTSETTYEVRDGVFTACEGDLPAWSFRTRSASIEVEGYARIKGASMRVKAAPVFYSPYLLWPTKTDRTSGLLVPKIGSSNDRGAYLGLAYYHVFGRSYDSTVYADLWAKDYFGLGGEFRYHPSHGTEGVVQAYTIWDPESDDQRWKGRWDHVTENLPAGLRGVLHYEDYSDFRFFRDFERRLEDKAKNSVYSSGFVSGNWGNHSFNLLVDQRQNFTNNREVVLRQLPEMQYRLRSTQIGGLPLYLALDSAAHYLSVDRNEVYQGEYGRLHFEPTVKVPLSTWPWLSASLTVGERLTWYGDSVDSTQGPTRFTGESLTRSTPFATAEIVGPSLSRVYEGGLGSFAKVKHIIEPRFDYHYSEEYEDRALLPVFDEIDSLDDGHVGRVALINRLLGKPKPKSDDETDQAAIEELGPLTAGEAAELEAREAALIFEDVEGIREVGGDVVAPVRVEAPGPEYSDAAREAGIEGAVIVKAIIDETGSVRQPQILSGLDPELDQAVLDTVVRWRFEPATLDGEPVSVFYKITTRFALTAGGDTASREIASFEVSRAYSFDEARPLESGPDVEPSAWGPWRATLRAYPGTRFGLRLDADYSDLYSQLTSVRLTGNVQLGPNRVDFSWSPRYRARDGETTSNQASLGFNWHVLPGRLMLRSAFNYDIERDLLRDQRHFLTFRGSCYDLRLEYHESKTASTTRRDYLFSVDLKNIGTFLDINGGESEGF